MHIHYDEEGDYIEIFIAKPRANYGEDLDNDITIFKDQKTDEILGLGILNFKQKSKNIKDIEVNLPFKIVSAVN